MTIVTDRSKLKGNKRLKSKVLIVDDEKTNLDTIYGMMLILGCHNRKEVCDFATNGMSAMKKVARSIEDSRPEMYKLILMDLKMSMMDGFQATKEIRKLYK